MVALIGAIAAIAGTALSAYGTYQAGQAQKAMANYNARLANNEAIAREQATKAETERMRDENRRIRASQEAGYSASGAMASSGTPLLVMAEEAGKMEMDVMNMQRTGAMQAQASRAQAKLDKYSGKMAARSANIGAGATLLTGTGSAAMSYSAAKTTG
jgi:hypothetical protein